MAKFLDANGVERSIEISVDAIEQVRSRFGINLTDLANGTLGTDLAQNPPLLMNVIGVLAFPGVPDAQAAEALADNAVIENAVTALLMAVVSTLPTDAVLLLCDDDAAMAAVTGKEQAQKREPCTFQDRHGQTCRVEVLFTVLERVRNVLKIDGTDLQALATLSDDPVK